MKKQLFIARPVKRYSAALVTSLILIFGIFDAKANDKDLTERITAAHDTFHTLAGECRKADD